MFILISFINMYQGCALSYGLKTPSSKNRCDVYNGGRCSGHIRIVKSTSLYINHPNWFTGTCCRIRRLVWDSYFKVAVPDILAIFSLSTDQQISHSVNRSEAYNVFVSSLKLYKTLIFYFFWGVVGGRQSSFSF